MKSIKPGRGPSMMGAIVGILVAVLGVAWTIGAANITSGMGGGFGDPFGGAVGIIFPLFGVVFVIIAIVGVVYNFKNATGKNRYSEYDIVDGDEEPDPLNERFGEPDSPVESKKEISFCPYCGNKIEGDYRYCNRCGKKLPERR